MPPNQPPNMGNNHEEIGQLQVMKNYFASGKLSDLIIITRAKSFAVHKLVICSQSDHFCYFSKDVWKAAKTAGDFKAFVNDSLCKAEHVIHLEDDDDDPEAIEAMLRFTYGLEYDSNPNHPSCLLFYSKLYRVADKYDVPHLKKNVVEKFEEKVKTSDWQTAYFVSALQNFPEDTYMYESGEEDMFDCLVNICREHIHDLLDCEEFDEWLDEQRIFARSLLWQVAGELAHHQEH